MMTLADTAKWFAEYACRLTQSCKRVRFEYDVRYDKASIGVESSSMITQATVWSNGTLEILAVEKSSRRTNVLIDRPLTPNESLPSLLTEYFEQILDSKEADKQ